MCTVSGFIFLRPIAKIFVFSKNNSRTTKLFELLYNDIRQPLSYLMVIDIFSPSSWWFF